MKIELKKTITVKETIDVDLPRYYEYDLYSDFDNCVIYGYIDEEKHVSIMKTESFDQSELKFELEFEKHTAIINTGLATYFESKYDSKKQTFDEIKQEALDYLKKF